MPLPRLLYFILPAFLTELAMFMTWVATPIYAIQRHQTDAVTLGLLGALSWGGYGVVAIIAGTLSDRTGRLRWIIGGLAGCALAIALLPHANSLTSFMLLGALTTTLLGGFWAPLQGMLSETSTPRRLIRELMTFNLSWSIGTILSSILVTILIDRGRMPAIFHTAACVIVVCLVAVAAFRPRRLQTDADEQLPPDPRASLLKTLAWTAVFGNFFLINMLIYVFPKIAQTPAFALSEASIARLHLFRTCGMSLTFAVMALWRGWRFRLWPMHLGFVLILGLTGLMALAPGMFGLALAFTALGVTAAASYAMSAFYSMISPEKKGAMLGVHELLFAGGNMLGPLVAGSVMQFTGDPQVALLATLAPLFAIWAAAIYFQRAARST